MKGWGLKRYSAPPLLSYRKAVPVQMEDPSIVRLADPVGRRIGAGAINQATLTACSPPDTNRGRCRKPGDPSSL